MPIGVPNWHASHCRQFTSTRGWLMRCQFLVLMAALLVPLESARAQLTLAGGIEMLGTVEGELRFTGGKVEIGGTVHRDTILEADEIRFDPGAQLMGNLTYHARNELEERGEADPAAQTPRPQKPRLSLRTLN